MPDMYQPSSQKMEELKSLLQGFLMEIDEDGMVILLIKLEASSINQLIRGCKIELVVRNPTLTERGTTLYVYDQQTPLWVSAEKLSEEDTNYLHFDKVIVRLIESEKVRIAYFNFQNLPIFTTILAKESRINEFNEWISYVFNSNENMEKVEDGYFLPETYEKGFKFEIPNEDNTNAEKLIIYSIDEELNWGEYWNGKDNFYRHSDFITDGKHGYDQELSIRANLSRFFEPGIELFHSPISNNKNEITDFLIHYKRAILLIESKFVISSKQTKLNQSILKAVKQLNTAEAIISSSPENILDSEIRSMAESKEIILRFCLHNDNLIIDEFKCRNLINTVPKKELPIFISVAVFFQLIGAIREQNEEGYKFNFIQNMINIYDNYLESDDKLLVVREFKLLK